MDRERGPGSRAATWTIHEVRKRDNRIVPFDLAKIADAIYNAFGALGQADRVKSNELAEIVRDVLEKNYSGRIPSIEEIQDQVVTVLSEVGYAKVANAYIRYRQQRTALRETLQVRKSPEEIEAIEDDPLAGEESSSSLPAVDHDVGGIAKWQKSKIAASLMKESDVEPGLAAEVASAVEQKVLASGLSRISTSLIRELVDNELFERGHGATLLKQAPIGMPLYTLEQVIFGSDVKEGYAFPKTPDEVRKMIANRVLHQYSLREVFAPEVAEAHRRGAIFIHRLSDPVRLASATWSLPLPGSLGQEEAEFPFLRETTSAGWTPRSRLSGSRAGFYDVADFFRRLGNLSCFFSEELQLRGLANLLEDTAGGRGAVEQSMRRIVERLAHLDDSARVTLCFKLGPQALPWLQVFEEFTHVDPGKLRLAVDLDPDERSTSARDAALDLVAAIYERGADVEFFCRSSVDDAGVGGFETHAAKITINLPHVAFRSARHQRTTFERELDAVVDLAVKGHLERREFLRRLGRTEENPLWELFGREGETVANDDYRTSAGPVVDLDESVFQVGVLGLNECVKFLTGKELHPENEEAAQQGLSIVRRVAEKLSEDTRRLGVRLVLEESANVGPLRTLERMDRARYAHFEEIEQGRQPQWGPRYTDGVRFHRLAPVDPLQRVQALTPYLRYVRPLGGIVEADPQLRDAARALLPRLLKDSLRHGRESLI